MSVFPVVCRAQDYETFTVSPPLALAIWRRLRESIAPDLSWFAVDVTIVSETEVQLHVRNMLDNYFGGIGEVVFETTVTNFTYTERRLLETELLRAYTEHAVAELERREEMARKQQILDIRKEMFGV